MGWLRNCTGVVPGGFVLALLMLAPGGASCRPGELAAVEEVGGYRFRSCPRIRGRNRKCFTASSPSRCRAAPWCAVGRAVGAVPWRGVVRPVTASRACARGTRRRRASRSRSTRASCRSRAVRPLRPCGRRHDADGEPLCAVGVAQRQEPGGHRYRGQVVGGRGSVGGVFGSVRRLGHRLESCCCWQRYRGALAAAWILARGDRWFTGDGCYSQAWPSPSRSRPVFRA